MDLPRCSLGGSMSGRSLQGKRKSQHRASDMSAPLAPDIAPYVGPTTEHEDVIFAGQINGYDLQVVSRTVRADQGGRLVDFAVCLQARAADADEGWAEVERVDCAHGFVHVDRLDADGRAIKDKDLVPGDCRTDLDRAMTWAHRYIWDIQARMTGWAR